MRRCKSPVRETRSHPIKGMYHEECRFQSSGGLCGREPERAVAVRVDGRERARGIGERGLCFVL